jgi:hypothetical protein
VAFPEDDRRRNELHWRRRCADELIKKAFTRQAQPQDFCFSVISINFPACTPDRFCAQSVEAHSAGNQSRSSGFLQANPREEI